MNQNDTAQPRDDGVEGIENAAAKLVEMLEEAHPRAIAFGSLSVLESVARGEIGGIGRTSRHPRPGGAPAHPDSPTSRGARGPRSPARRVTAARMGRSARSRVARRGPAAEPAPGAAGAVRPLFEADFLVERRPEIVRRAFELRDALPERLAQLGQLPRTEHNQCDDENKYEFRDANGTHNDSLPEAFAYQVYRDRPTSRPWGPWARRDEKCPTCVDLAATGALIWLGALGSPRRRIRKVAGVCVPSARHAGWTS